MAAIFQDLQPKDVLTLCVGSVALLLSGIGLVHSIFSKTRESQKAAQGLFDSAIISLVELRKEREDYRIEHGEDWGRHKFGTLRVSINDRRELLLSQAIQLSTKYRLDISDISFVIIGSTLMDSSRPGEAIDYYRQAF